MSGKIPAPIKPLSDAGVTFYGYLNIEIPSRKEAVSKQLDDFLRYSKTSKKPAARVIIGAWGEGKTDTFGRYIKPKTEQQGDYAFFVSASTIANSLDDPKLNRLLQTTPNSAIRFLVALFYSIREENDDYRIPYAVQYNNAVSYIEETLRGLIKESSENRVYVFIDEFEELLSRPTHLSQIVSGIKEVLNGLYKEIDEEGRFAGRLHLIIACTPDAWNQLQIKDDVSQIFGGLARRIGLIELPEVSKYESINFLLQLLKHVYDGKLPSILPIKNSGVLNIIYRVAHGNPGNMVSLLDRLLNSATISDEIRVIDYNKMIDFLSRESVFVYGGYTRCLELDNLNKIKRRLEEIESKSLSEKCILVLNLLLGELKPFKEDEIKERIGGDTNVPNIISILNETLSRKEGITRSVLRLSPVREGKTFDDIIKALQEYVEDSQGKKHIIIDNFREAIESFKERITHWFLEDNELRPTMFLPSDDESILAFFEGVSKDRALEIKNIFRKRLCSDEYAYIASEQLLSQIYPTAVPWELEFLKDKENRMKVWRDLTKNFSSYFDRYIIESLLSSAQKLGVLDYHEVDKKGEFDHVNLSYADFELRTLFFAKNGDVLSEDIEKIWSYVKSVDPPVHVVFVIYTGLFKQEAEEKVINKGLGEDGENLIIGLKLHPTVAKRLIGIRLAMQSFKDNINQEILDGIIRKIGKEIDLRQVIDTWLDRCGKVGKLVRYPVLKETSNPKELAEALKFFINFIDLEDTIDNIYEKNLELGKFISFGSKRYSLYPDINLPKLKNISEDLLKNELLCDSAKGYKVVSHQVERRILEILNKRGGTFIGDELSKYFIVETKRPRIIKDVYLPILKHKGLVVEEGQYLRLTHLDELEERVNRALLEFNRFCSNIDNMRYGYIYMTKERDDKLIILEELKSYLNKLHDQAKSDPRQEVKFQKLALINLLLDHFNQELRGLISNAINEGKKLVEQLSSIKTELLERMCNITSNIEKLFKLSINKENLSDYLKVTRLYQEIEEWHAKKNVNDIKTLVEREIRDDRELKESFRFDKDKNEAAFFNPRLFKIRAISSNLNKMYDVGLITDLEDKLLGIINNIEKVNNSLASVKIFDGCDISLIIRDFIRKSLTDIYSDLKIHQLENTSIRDLYNIVMTYANPIMSRIQELNSSLKSLAGLIEEEKKVKNTFQHLKEISKTAHEVLDINKYKREVETLSKELADLENSYRSLSKLELDLESLSDKIVQVRRKLDNLQNQLEGIENKLNNVWLIYRDSMVRLVHNTYELVKLMRYKYKNMNFSDIVDQLNNFEKMLRINDLKSVKQPLRVIEEMFESITHKFEERVSDILSPSEIDVLKYLAKNTNPDKPWISVSQIKRSLINELTTTEERVGEILSKLVAKGLCEELISLKIYTGEGQPPCPHEEKELIGATAKKVIWECKECGERIIEET